MYRLGDSEKVVHQKFNQSGADFCRLALPICATLPVEPRCTPKSQSRQAVNFCGLNKRWTFARRVNAPSRQLHFADSGGVGSSAEFNRSRMAFFGSAWVAR